MAACQGTRAINPVSLQEKTRLQPLESTTMKNFKFSVVECPLCGIECTDKDALFMHQNSEHGGQGLTPSSIAPSSPTSPQSNASPTDKEAESTMDFDDNNEEFMQEIRTPKVSTSGKVKVFKCKQCGYVAITKSDFWEHTRAHIKPDKLLQCPKCPFVSEYKHHLEYHLRNHFNSKPFRWDFAAVAVYILGSTFCYYYGTLILFISVAHDAAIVAWISRCWTPTWKVTALSTSTGKSHFPSRFQNRADLLNRIFYSGVETVPTLLNTAIVWNFIFENMHTNPTSC